MIRIKTPATSANLAVGFDALGLALSLYNTFVFEPTKTTKLIGFSTEYANTTNLVYRAYEAFASTYQRNIQPVTITLEHSDIPASRGLGSSASCIVAGVLASNHLHQLGKSVEECVTFAATYEGHPDNVYACMYGALTAVFQTNNTFVHHTFAVATSLHATLCIPRVTGTTTALRAVLPDVVSRNDAVFHLSRMIHVPRAFQHADIELLQVVLNDRIHEQYRYPSIPEYELVLELKKRLDGILTISGSGPTLLVLSNKDMINQLQTLQPTYSLVPVTVSNGTTIEVIG